MNRIFIHCLLIAFCTACAPLRAQITLPHLIADSMVLQRNTPINIWGWAQPGEKVSIQFAGKTYNTTTGANSEWLVKLQSMPAGGPYDMHLDASNHLTLANIMVGDVWLCSGQSNMVLPMERVKERYPTDIAQANYPAIRQFFLPTVYNFNGPQADVPPGHWVAATPQTVLSFSAAAYFFARAIYSKYHVPIGIINSSVGGSPAQAWLSEGALKAFPKYYAMLQQCKNTAWVDSIKKSDAAASAAWYKNINDNDAGLHGAKPWYDTAANTAAWPAMQLPGYWGDADTQLQGVNGVVWFSREFTVPAQLAGKPAKLMLGRIIDADYTYINGTQVGNITYQYPPRRYNIAAGLLQPGKNIITVRVISNAGNGGFVPDKPYTLTIGSEAISLAGLWHYRLGTASAPLGAATFFQYKPAGLFNSMVAPLLNYNIKGVLWYQGESNTGEPNEYFALLPALINDWRSYYHNPALPFIYVQLPNYLEAQPQPAESANAIIREAQRRTLALPHTAMAIAIDVGEWNDIHPLNKKAIGERLALAAEKLAYGDKRVVASGPLYHGMQVKGSKIYISFTSTGSGLVTNGTDTLRGFAIASPDKHFIWARAAIQGNKVVVYSDAIPHPACVRYAWADNPATANLYNKEGLPASPFTTEEF